MIVTGRAIHYPDRFGLTLPDIPADTAAELKRQLGANVTISNPFDFQTFNWHDPVAMRAMFATLIQGPDATFAFLADHPDVIAGQGTIGMEMRRQHADPRDAPPAIAATPLQQWSRPERWRYPTHPARCAAVLHRIAAASMTLQPGIDQIGAQRLSHPHTLLLTLRQPANHAICQVIDLA